tara:strand:+ start:7575 stop:8240 length:666 start_codon:yes stop_codon:yes gene_type:complete
MGFMSRPQPQLQAPISPQQNIANMFEQAKGVKGWRNKKAAITAAREALARFEMKRFKNVYENITISNPYRDMENAFEDLTINQQQNKFEEQTFQQSQSNILNTIRRSGGSSGVSSIAQSLAQQGQIAAQKSAANIGAQEQALQVYAPQEQARLDQLEASGKNISAMFEKEKMAKLMGMSQMEMFAHINEQHKIDADASKANMEKWSLISGLMSMGPKTGLG